MSCIRKSLRWTLCACTLLLIDTAFLGAASLNLRVESGGQTTVTVPPGSSVPYVVVGELSDALSQGLALVSFDLSFSGGPLSPAQPPTTAPMASFAVPAGINNPQGFGGVPRDGTLVQVGGAQNTMKNTFGPYPIGAIRLGVALPGQPVTIVAGSVQAPLPPGSYTLTPSTVVANVIAEGAIGIPVWKVEAAGPGILLPLTVVVEDVRPASPGRRHPAK